MKQKTTVYLDPDILTATKAAALTSKRTEGAVVEEALRVIPSRWSRRRREG
jgi:hypothetical protein